MDNKLTVLAVGGAFAIGAVGSNALADDDDSSGPVNPVKVAQEERDHRDDERREDDRERDNGQGQAARDDDDVDVEPRDDDDDEGGSDGDSNSAVVPAPAPAPAPEPAPAPAAPVYDDGGSDYGDT